MSDGPDANALRLENRDRLPAGIAYLLAKFPRPGWPGDDNFDGIASHWIAHHDRLRDVGGLLQASTASFREGALQPAEFRAFLAPRLRWFLQILEGHHHFEDTYLFPPFRALDPRLVSGMDLLEQDHETIHHHLEASAASGQLLLQALAADGDAARRAADAHADQSGKLLHFMMRHLDDEEDLVIPTILDRGGRIPGI